MTVRSIASNRLRRLGVALTVAVAGGGSALVASGCGSVGSVLDPVAKAASISNASPGYRMRFSVRLTSSALPTGMSATGSGSFDGPAHAGSVTTKLDFGNSPQLAGVLGGSSLSLIELISNTTV